MYYKHYEKKEPTYSILTAGHVQIDNEWFEAVIYQDVHSKKVYVRKSDDFELKFKVI